mgnify:FL=1
MKEYRVMASSMDATYTAGRFVAKSAQEACQMARDEYHRRLGRILKDTGAFRFYTVSKFQHEMEEQDVA